MSHLLQPTNTQTFNLQLLQTIDYQKYNLNPTTLCDKTNNNNSMNNRNIVQLSYTIIAGNAVCMRLKIQKCAYRLLRKSCIKMEKENFMVVLVLRCQQLPTNCIKAPYNIIQNFSNKVSLHRVNLGIYSNNLLKNTLLPQLNQATQLYLFVNTSSLFLQLIKQYLTIKPFVICLKRQEIFVNVCWFKNYISYHQNCKQNGGNNNNFNAKFGIQMMMEMRRLIAENCAGRYTNYLKINIKGIVQHEGDEKYNSCLFIPNKTKLTIQKAVHYDLNQIVKIIKLTKLQQRIYNLSPFHKLYLKVKDQIQYKPDKKILLLKCRQNNIGLTSFLHNLAQCMSYTFLQINCKYFASDKQLIDKIKYSDSYTSTVIFIKNIQWLLEVGSDKNDDQQKMKRILRMFEDVFYNLGDCSLSSHVLIIEYKGNCIRLDMIKNGQLVIFGMEKEEKLEILTNVVEEFQNQEKIELSDPEEVVNLAVNSVGWTLFAKILGILKINSQNQQKIKTQTVIKQIGKLVNMQKVQNIKSVTWDDVGGLESAKQQIIQTILLPTKHPQIFDEWIKPRTGLLFFGPPGTGKTLLGKCIANQCKMGFISVKGPQLLNMYIGQSQKNVRDVFQRAEASRPCIVFMDQLDALIPKRGQSSDSNQVMDRIVSQLLTQMDKAPSRGIFIIGATNRPDLLDPSILRPGRFDKQIYLGITKQKQARIQILKAQTRHIKLQQNFDYGKVIDNVPQNFTGADFYGLTSRSITKAAQRFIESYQKGLKKQNQEVIITQQDFIQTAKYMKPSVSLNQLSHYQKLKQQYK